MLAILEATLGLDFINTHMIHLSNYMGKFTTENLSTFTNIARALGAIFAMIAIAMHLYKVMSRGEAIDILAIMRPFAFALILSVWPGFCNMLTYPGQLLEGHFASVFEIEKNKVYEKREQRNQAAWKYNDSLRERMAAAEQAKAAAGENSDESLLSAAWDYCADAGSWVLEQFKSWSFITQSYLNGWIESGFMWIGELFWQCGVYFIFLIKNIYLCVLTMFGPIFMMASILPAWQNKWGDWVGKMVHVSFYGVMAYIVMIFSLQLMIYTVGADTEALTKATTNLGYGEFTGNMFGTMTLTLTSLFAGFMALKMVPELATWVFPSGIIHSAGGFISGTAGSMPGASKKGAKSLYKGLK